MGGIINATVTKPILVCYDGSEGARHAIRTVGELFPGRNTIVLHAWSPVAIICAAYGGAVRLASYDDETLQRVEATKVAQAGCGLANETGLKKRSLRSPRSRIGAPGTPSLMSEASATPSSSCLERAGSPRSGP